MAPILPTVVTRFAPTFGRTGSRRPDRSGSVKARRFPKRRDDWSHPSSVWPPVRHRQAERPCATFDLRHELHGDVAHLTCRLLSEPFYRDSLVELILVLEAPAPIGLDQHIKEKVVATESRRTAVRRALMQSVVTWAAGTVRYLEWQAHETRAAPFYKQLGYRGGPCPQPDYPFFEITFR